MKKVLVICAALAAAPFAMADGNNAQKLQVVKKIYANGGSHAALLRYATQDLKSVFREDERNTPAGDLGCIDYDVVVQGQDSNPAQIKRSLKTSVQSNGNVAVSFKNMGSMARLTYVMKCSSGRCLVDDVLESGKSFKRSIRQCIQGY